MITTEALEIAKKVREYWLEIDTKFMFDEWIEQELKTKRNTETWRCIKDVILFNSCYFVGNTFTSDMLPIQKIDPNLFPFHFKAENP